MVVEIERVTKYNFKMIYLLYRENGYEKKYPIRKKSFKVGRENPSDLIIKDNLISREHLEITAFKSFIRINDMESSNGIFVDGKKRETVDIKIGEHFRIGETEFFLFEGARKEFLISKNIYHNKKTNAFQNRTNNPKGVETEAAENIIGALEKELFLNSGGFNDFPSFYSFLYDLLSGINGIGSFFFIMNHQENFELKFSINSSEENLRKILFIIRNNSDILDNKKMKTEQKIADSNDFSFVTSDIDNGHMSIIHFPGILNEKNRDKTEKFINFISRELKLISAKLKNRKQLGNIPEKEKPDLSYITNNKQVKILLEQVMKIARSDINILIQGESGVGKELFARIIHNHSERSNKNFVAINCAAIPENLLESELYGYEKGAFTGANSQLKGKLEIASGGTLVLDEVGDMPLPLQAKLLRAIQEQEFYRLGGSKPIKVNLRIVSLTNMDLSVMIKEKMFREDLYYRIVHRSMTIPPLRERKEDIIALTNYFTKRACNRKKKYLNGYSVKAFESLINYNWPGNIRQLENEINSIVRLLDDGEIVDNSILSDEIRNFISSELTPVKSPVQAELTMEKKDQFFRKPEKEEIIEILERNNWNKTRSAKELNMTYQGLHKKMKKLKIEIR